LPMIVSLRAFRADPVLSFNLPKLENVCEENCSGSGVLPRYAFAVLKFE